MCVKGASVCCCVLLTGVCVLKVPVCVVVFRLVRDRCVCCCVQISAGQVCVKGANVCCCVQLSAGQVCVLKVPVCVVVFSLLRVQGSSVPAGSEVDGRLHLQLRVRQCPDGQIRVHREVGV